ncbi:MAG: DLW-39 family protein [Arcanobacterium sp.]
MKKFIIGSLAVVGGYAAFLKVTELVHRQATWHQVTDPVE